VAQTAGTGRVAESSQGTVTTVTKELKKVPVEEQKQNPFAEQEDLYQIQDVSPEKVRSAVEDINKQIKQTHTYCQFAYHDDTNRITITVKDADTGDVIREIPPEKTLDMIAKAWELAGLMVDEKR
ncbi:MAG: flagellar protein FlaG, partial [Lachnospiraceae bacterium]|nr:flagellar protein FlaG [Lachnospiraceae bacterium]